MKEHIFEYTIIGQINIKANSQEEAEQILKEMETESIVEDSSYSYKHKYTGTYKEDGSIEYPKK